MKDPKEEMETKTWTLVITEKTSKPVKYMRADTIYRYTIVTPTGNAITSMSLYGDPDLILKRFREEMEEK